MSKILFAVSGSISCIKAAQAVSKLVQRGNEVQVIATASALKFVGSATWEGLTGKPVLSDIFAEGHQMDHIHLARWSDLLILCPASANAIANWSLGLASDLPSALYLAYEKTKPVLIAPSMNKEMWSHPAVQENLERLRSRGVHIIEPEEGSLACGETGMGRLASPETIIARIHAAGKSQSSFQGRVLITSGGTREPIDQVRFITNMSSGKTGAVLADHFAECGFQVTYLHAEAACLPENPAIQKDVFTSFSSLETKLRERLSSESYDLILQAAAVSDFSVDDIAVQGESQVERAGGKLGSDQDLVLNLKRNAKLVLNLKEWSGRRETAVIAFKLTDTSDAKERAKAVDRLLERPEIDAVVWNDLSGIAAGSHSGAIFFKNGTKLTFASKAELADKLVKVYQDGGKYGLGH